MPKIKTNRGAAKRFTLTKNKKVKRNKANKSHILTKKNADRKRNLRKSTIATPGDAKRIKKMLGT